MSIYSQITYTEIIFKAANDTIPLSRRPEKKNSPAWYKSDISIITGVRQKASKNFKGFGNKTKIINCRKLFVVARREWEKHVYTLRSDKYDLFSTIYTGENQFTLLWGIANPFFEILVFARIG